MSSNVQRTPNTVLAYNRIYNRALEKCGHDDAIAVDLITRSKTLSKSTVRQYRAAFAHVWELRGRDDLIAAVSDCVGAKSKDLPKRTSAKKAKNLTFDDLLKLCESLVIAGELQAAAWMRCGYVTGLRPIEWNRASVVGNCLIVRNAKATNGRSHGEEREIVITSSQELHNIAALCMKLGGPDYEKHRLHVSRAIKNHARTLWPKSEKLPSLYTARHAFSAEAKATLSKEEVAALMGHASTETAGRHYSRRRYASGFLKVRPSAQDVAAVISKNKKPGAKPGLWV